MTRAPILFAAGDVGGARAVLPVARLAHASGYPIKALKHGIFAEEGDPAWDWVDFGAAAQLAAGGVAGVIYATSVQDQLAFQLALLAQQAARPVIHVLDNWASYAQRLSGADLSGTKATCIPDVYAVMDDLALKQARAACVPEQCLIVTGHPGLAKIEEERTTYGGPDRSLSILFVSEPASKDSGLAADPKSRGYDEISVAEQFVQALKMSARKEHLTLSVAPHPREDRNAVSERWASLCAGLPSFDLRIVPPDGVRQALHGATHVVGMSSILLYEAWLLERPTLSLQPELRYEELKALGHRQGVRLCTKSEEISGAVVAWLHDSMPVGAGGVSRAQHAEAARKIFELARQSFYVTHPSSKETGR